MRVERGKRAALVAREIEDDIAAAGWQVGTVFGTESELTERYGASRSVMREAVRLVEHHKVARMRRGPAGGLIVQEPDPRGAATALVIYLEHVGTSVADLMDVRLVLEPLAAGLTAQRLDEEAISILRTAVEEESAPVTDGPVARIPDRVHHAIARACGNPVLRLFLDVLEDLSEHFAARPRRMTREEVAAMDRQVRVEHVALVDAITAGERGRAEHLAAEHLAAMREILLKTAPNGRAWKGTTYRPPAEPGKLAEALAEQIRLDLTREGRAVGEVVGSENDVRERYNVSRQVLREAVRLLEHHGVAKMQRGPGGGLVVTQPDPWASIEAIAVYLDYQRIDIDDLRAVRTAVELACVDRVIERRSDPSVIERLTRAVDFDESASPDALKGLVHDVHRELAILSANPVLDLFLCVLASLWERHGLRRRTASPLRNRALLGQVKSAHASLVEAVLAGDAKVARNRMTRHLDALTAWWQ
ncbi:MAG TPA: FCD domain-containing protein [Mycobacteriales bacterium]|nr:FCD domain-containing protein [Mycobacteriales bacterium]